ncbi:MAG: C10 family peptidase [Ignavibacteriales bacterium]|nr:C10 family peptidase [Ignavibacteriales bacterium]MCF8314689.1 C10 family peptidase [Ignavibacteriales bacterium]MCF8436274.1 C10 family peptidase [Ignavibacteriales bacterium]
MRPKLFLISFFAAALIASAVKAQLNESNALATGKAKIFQLEKNTDFTISCAEKIFNEQGNILFFVLRLKPTGYVVVSGREELPPVIAYSFTDQFGELNDENILLSLLKVDLELRTGNLNFIPQKMKEERIEQRNQMLQAENTKELRQGFHQWPPEGTSPTGGWLRSNWKQSSPYNNFCPIDPVTNSRSVAGCPATAMAMVINFQQTLNGVFFSDADDYYHHYSGRNYWIDNDYIARGFPSFPQLNDYLTTLSNHYSNNLSITNADKAALTFACGIAAKQVYTSSISGTFGVDQAFQAYLKFNFENSRLVYDGDGELYTLMALNILDTLTVHFASVTPAQDAGHNFVIDGYNTDNFFHINFGWGGTYNGWYLLPDEIPYGLTVVEGAVVNIARQPFEADGDNKATFARSLQIPVIDKTGIIYPEEDEDWYRVYANAGDIILIQPENISNFKSDVKAWLYGPSDPGGAGVQLTDFIASGNLTGNIVSKDIEYKITQTGYYFIRIADCENKPGEDERCPKTGAYHLNISFSQTDITEVAASGKFSAPELFELKDNYPNPFNPSTNISFSLPVDCSVNLKIYDALGAEILTLLDEFKTSGKYTVKFDAGEYTGGIYFYKLTAGGFSMAKKMILIK